MSFELRTARLLLRDLRASAFDIVHAYASDLDVVRFMDWGPNSESDTRAFLERSWTMANAEPRSGFELGVAELNSNTLLGAAGLHVDGTGTQGMIGYCFAKTAWGRGIAVEASLALLGLDGRHGHRRQRDAAGAVSRLGKPHIGSSNAFSFNVASVRGVGSITIEKGAGKTEKRTFTVAGGMCPRCEGMGSVTDIDLSQLYDDTKSLAEGAITVPGYNADGWSVRMFTESGFLDPDKPIRKYTKRELHDFLHREPTKRAGARAHHAAAAR